jgi:hypothetical protein
MADDDRPDARDDLPDGEVAAWLAVEPLDEVTRRRLVSTAVRETAAPKRRRAHALRWIAAAAAIVVLGAGTLAVVTAGGGSQESQTAAPALTPEREAAGLAPKSAADATTAPVEVGDFGDLDDGDNLTRLRAALVSGTSTGAPDRSGAVVGSGPTSLSQCAATIPDATVVAQGSGTLDGRPATVVLVEHPDGSRSFEAIVSDPCEARHLP